MPRAHRTSSSLGAELRGDTGGTALSTLEPTPHFTSPIPSPSLSPRSSQSKPLRPHSKRRKARTYLRRWQNFSFQETWVNPLLIILVTLALYALNPTPSNPIHSLLFVSYSLPTSHPFVPAHARSLPDHPTFYGKGPRDFLFVAFYIVVLTFTREFMMQRRILRKWAIFCGMRSRGMQNRHMEQVYTAVYFTIFGPLGLYIMSRTPVWYFNTEGMFADYPHRSHEGLFKAYYLLQAAYWAQQAIVLCMLLEKPRKDFKELVGHHIITLALIWLSYRFHFTYMGVAVYVTHDISDFFLASCKTLNYGNHHLRIPYFILFIGIWIYLRHYLNIQILLSLFSTYKTVGPYVLNWHTQQYKSWISQYITFGLLATLQSINLFWLYCIVRVAVNAVVKKDTRDVRSDDEEEVEVEGKKGIENGKASGATKKKEGMNGEVKGRGKALNRAAMNGLAVGENALDEVEPAKAELKKQR